MVESRNHHPGSHFSWHCKKQSGGGSWRANNLCDGQDATGGRTREWQRLGDGDSELTGSRSTACHPPKRCQRGELRPSEHSETSQGI